MKKALLAVLAHPDDESFGPGGTLARYAREGVTVHIAIATDGAAGSVVAGYEDSREQLATVRAEELKKAVNILGATLHNLGYRDSGYVGDPANQHPAAFIQADLSEATGRIVALIRTIQPQVVITHDESGGYFHPDHIMCWKITRPAFFAAGDPNQYPHLGPAFQPQRLYYTALPNSWLKIFTFLMRLRGQDPTKAGRNQDIDLTKIGQPMGQIQARINIYKDWETKLAAGAEHKSQGGGTGFNRALPRWLQKWLLRTEYFMRDYPPPTPKLRETSLFPSDQ